MTFDDLKAQLQVVADTYGAIAGIEDSGPQLSGTFTMANGLELKFPVSLDWTPEHVRRYAREAAELPLVPGTDKPQEQDDTLIVPAAAVAPDADDESTEPLSELALEPAPKKKRKFFS